MALRLSIRAVLVAILLLSACSKPAATVGQDSNEPLTQEQLFDDTRLIDIQIEIDEADWKKLSAQTLDFVSAFSKSSFENNYTYFPGTITIDGRRLEGVELRKKGFFGSMDQLRPSLKVRIDDKKQIRTLGGLGRLTLNNNKQDRANVSQILAYRLFREAGLPAPRCALAKVSVNGESLGIYTHVESIDDPFLERTFGNAQGDLYEGVFPTDFMEDRLERFEVKTNKKKNEREDLRRIAELIANPSEDLAQELDKIIDVDQFITHWALESLIGFWDGYAANQNNYYLYKDAKDSKLHFIPWGADMTLVPPFFPTGGSKSVYAKGLLAYHLNQDPEIRQRYHERLLGLLEKVWREDELIAEVDRIEGLVSGHLHEAQGGIAQAAETTRTFITNRRQEIMEDIKDGPVHITTPPAKPFYIKEVGEVAGKFSTEWTPADVKEPKLSEDVNLEIELNGEVVTLQHVSANAGPARFPRFGPGQQGPPPPAVVLTGIRESDQKKVTLTITFGPDQLNEVTKEPVPVQGMMTEGEGFMFGAAVRTFAGKAELTSAGQEAGAVVAGSISGKLYEMRGFGR